MRKLNVSRTGYVWDEVYIRVKSHMDGKRAVYRKEKRQLEFKIYSNEMRRLWQLYADKYISSLTCETKSRIIREYHTELRDSLSKVERDKGIKPECRLTTSQILYCYYSKNIWPAFEEDIRIKIFKGRKFITVNTKGMG